MDGDASRDFGQNARDTQTGARNALIVAASPINRIVIARTIERIYLKPLPVPPESALSTLKREQTAVVIIDTPEEDDLLKPLLAELASQRRASGERLPRVLLIVGPDQIQRFRSPTESVDATFSKPITPDRLQPVVERIINS